MRLNLLTILLSFASLGSADINTTGCDSIPLSGDYSNTSEDDSDIYLTCSGNFSDMKKLKESLENIKDTIAIFELQNALLDALPPDIFHDVRKPSIRKIIFRNTTMGLLGIPDLGFPPFKTIKDTVESLEIYRCSSVFAWNLQSLDFEHLKTIIIEDSDVTAIAHAFSVWPNLRFIQLAHTGIYWLHDNAFRYNKKLAICSLAYNRIMHISRNLFPKPASYLYSIDLSFNKLLWLPDDIFSDMNVLQELKLDNNNLIKVSFKLLSPVWSNLTQLWLHGNPVDCQSLCWIAETVERPLFLESSSCKTKSQSVILIDANLQHCASGASFDYIISNGK